MSLAGLWQRVSWPVRTAASVWWAMQGHRDLSPVPAARTIEEAALGAAVLSAHYRADPMGGYFDYSEDPRRVQYHLERGTLGLLPGLDCDDVAFWAVAALREIANPCHVLILNDETLRFSHAICEAWVAGRHITIDTSGLHDVFGWPSVGLLYQSIWTEARYTDEMRVAYPFADPGRVP